MEEKLAVDSDADKRIPFAEKYALRLPVRILAEEIVMREVVNVFH